MKFTYPFKDEERLYYFPADLQERFGAESVKKLTDELAADAEDIKDFYSRIDTLTSGSEKSECLKILCIGAGIAKRLGWRSEESRYVSAIRENLEKTGDRVSALEVEKKYCYSKDENFSSDVVLPHCIHLIRIAHLLGRKAEVNKCLFRTFHMFSFRDISVDVISALNDLSKVCDYDNWESREMMQDILNDCVFIFPSRKKTYDDDSWEWIDIPDPPKDELDEMVQDWSEREFTIPEGAIKIQNGKYYFDDDFDIPEEDCIFEVPANDKGIAISDDPEHITWINVPSTVTKIGRAAFCGFPAIIAIEVDTHNPVFHDKDGVLFEGTILRLLPRGKKMKMYDIPGSVTQIGNEAFFGYSSLTKVNIPDSVTKIGYRAFQCCSSLNEINIPQSVTEIGDDAFSECYSLQTVYAPKDLDLSKTGIPTDAEII